MKYLYLFIIGEIKKNKKNTIKNQGEQSRSHYYRPNW